MPVLDDIVTEGVRIQGSPTELEDEWVLYVRLPFDRGGANEMGNERMRITSDRSWFVEEK